jgi:periplasmic divalent cation tolerance protein
MTMTMTTVVQVQVAHDGRGALQAMLDTLLAERLIACGQILGPIRSTYRWEGETHHEEEWLALLKTAAAARERLVARIAQLHSYEVPEIIVTEVSGGHAPYLEWVVGETSD